MNNVLKHFFPSCLVALFLGYKKNLLKLGLWCQLRWVEKVFIERGYMRGKDWEASLATLHLLGKKMSFVTVSLSYWICPVASPFTGLVKTGLLLTRTGPLQVHMYDMCFFIFFILNISNMIIFIISNSIWFEDSALRQLMKEAIKEKLRQRRFTQLRIRLLFVSGLRLTGHYLLLLCLVIITLSPKLGSWIGEVKYI